MPRALLPLFLFSSLPAACAATGDSSSPATYTPVSGAGPFRRLPSDKPYDHLSAPYVLFDNSADLDQPAVIADGDRLALWVTVHPAGMGGSRIERSDADTLENGFGPLAPALVADAAWEAGSVGGAAVLPGSPWILFYGANGRIGWASSSDGHSWQKAPGPALTANGVEEGMALGPPAAVRLGARVRLYYPAHDALWAAEAAFADLAALRPAAWTRLDGDPTTPARDPMVAAPPYASSLGRASARAASTPAGRLRHDLYFTATLTSDAKVKNIGFAASFTGDRFAIAQTPVFAMPPARDPAMTPYRVFSTDHYQEGALLLYTGHDGVHDAVGAALSP